MGSAWGNPGPIQRSAPTTWEEQERQKAQDQFSTVGQQAISDQATARTRATGAGTAADAAIAGMGGQQPSAMAGWAAKGAPPSSMDKWMASMPSWSGGGAPSQAVSFGRGGGGGGGANAWDKFSSEELRTFDPQAAGTQFATGAYGDFKNKLGDEMTTLQNKAVGAGRLRTGWLDKDQGQTITRLGEDFSNSLNRAALEYSGQRLQGLTAATGFEADRARGTNDFTTANLDRGSREAMATAEIGSREGIERNRMAMEGWGKQLDAAGQADARAMDWNKFTSGLDFDQRKFLDTLDFDKKKAIMDAALGRERTYLDDANTKNDAASGYASSALDRADYAKELADLKAEIARLRGDGKARVGIGRESEPNPYAGTSLASYYNPKKRPLPSGPLNV